MLAQIFSIDSRQDEFIERVVGIADEHPEHGEMSGIRAENFLVEDQQRLVMLSNAMAGALQLAQGLFAQGRTCAQVLEMLMPS